MWIYCILFILAQDWIYSWRLDFNLDFLISFQAMWLHENLTNDKTHVICNIPINKIKFFLIPARFVCSMTVNLFDTLFRIWYAFGRGENTNCWLEARESIVHGPKWKKTCCKTMLQLLVTIVTHGDLIQLPFRHFVVWYAFGTS